jgi:hypothetical protein
MDASTYVSTCHVCHPNLTAAAFYHTPWCLITSIRRLLDLGSSATDSISIPTPSDPFAHPTSNATGSSDSSAPGLFPTSYLLSEQPIILQYVFFLLLCALETIAFHLPIRTLLSLRLPRPLSYLIPHYPHPAVISTALLVSSFTKLFPLLLLIWRYDLPSSASAVSWAVIINNVAALEILLECGVIRAAVLAAVGAVCRAGVGWVSCIMF